MGLTHWRGLAGCALLGALLWGCSPRGPQFFASENPQRLSDWNLFELDATALTPVPASLVFSPANQLFTDYAQKLRTLWLPEGSSAQMVNGVIDYPVGTILSKTFFYPVDAQGNAIALTPEYHASIDLHNNKLVETRLLVRRASGWDAFPYVWNEEQTEAFLRVAGATRAIALQQPGQLTRFNYFVPNENQCAGCHVTEHPDGDLHPLAATARQLRTALPADSKADWQIETLVARGWLDTAGEASATESWLDPDIDLNARAAAYLHVHCSHCHNPQGAADTSALILDGSHHSPTELGICKPPVAAGGGAGDRLFAIVPGAADRSILLYRMQSTQPDEMMPELGRSLVHSEGIDLIRRWIDQLPGDCL